MKFLISRASKSSYRKPSTIHKLAVREGDNLVVEVRDLDHLLEVMGKQDIVILLPDGKYREMYEIVIYDDYLE